MNEAYSYGGPKLVIKTFKQLTGLPINGWIEVNFSGFWHVVNILGGVYLPIDHKYFVPASADYKSINLEPGYQLVRGKQALNYVRFRHDEFYDFGRMQRQQLFLRELQRQSGRWSGDWKKVIKLIRAITGETESSFSSLRKIEPLVELAFEVDTSKVYQAHLEGANAMINGASVVQAATDRDRRRGAPVHQPDRCSRLDQGAEGQEERLPRCTSTTAAASTGWPRPPPRSSRRRATTRWPRPTPTSSPARRRSSTRPRSWSRTPRPSSPCSRRRTSRSSSGHPAGQTTASRVFVASSFDGTINIPQEVVQEQQTLEKNQKVDWATWKAYDAKTPIKLEAPTAWSSGFTYDQWRNYNIETTEGKRSAASVAVVQTAQYGYWSIQAMRWQDPPAIQNPDSTQTIKGRKFMLFYQGDHLHMVAWREHGTLYWVINTLDNQLSNDLMLGLATSCKPVK